MYIRRALIQNIRSIQEVDWSPRKEGAGWHVVLGDNGSGKSSFLRALALALVGSKEAQAARQDWNAWLRTGATTGLARVEIVPNANYDFFSGKGRIGASQWVAAIVRLNRIGEPGEPVQLADRRLKSKLPGQRHVWGSGSGWFSAAYGPFRRFTGGDKESERSFLSNPRLGAHISVFGENVALTESLYWLRELNYKKLEHSPEGSLLTRLKQFVNQDGFLPHQIKLTEVSSKGVTFEDAKGFPIPVEQLGDGYRSILSMTFELIRQVSRVYQGSEIFGNQNLRVVVPGVVMIDEVDAHLHPTWQKKVGFWFTEHFPNMQFIVTTHSPLICQAAVEGSIFHLPRPSSEDDARMLEGSDRDRLIYGDILDAYSTEAFGNAATRSTEAGRMHERLAILNVKELSQRLSRKEKQEQLRLRAAFPTAPHNVGPLGDD
jgi:energy-coupling factor transporter ATP-binding protein EcfA2